MIRPAGSSRSGFRDCMRGYLRDHAGRRLRRAALPRRRTATLLLIAVTAAAASGAAPDLDGPEALIAAGRAEEATAELRAIIRRAPDEPEPRFMLANALTSMGQFDEAVEVYRQLTRDFPDRPEPHNNLAVIYVETGRLEEARTALLAAARLRPSYARAWDNLGDVYTMMARASYERAADLRVAAEDRATDASTSPSSDDASEVVDEPALTDARATASDTPSNAPRSRIARTATPSAATGASIADPSPADRNQPSPTEMLTRRRLTATLDAWARAWSDQDAQAYLAHYSERFRPPEGASLEAWRQLRRRRIGAPDWIDVSVTIEDLELRGADRAVVEFRQAYRASNYSDDTRKRLVLERSDDAWLIVAEDTL